VWLAWLLVGIGLSGCSLTPVPPVCPATFDEARSGDFETVDDNTFIATGTVIRFVNAPDPEFRGYDIAVARHDGPVFVDGVVFIRAAEPVAGIAIGQPVLVLGERTDRRNLITPGVCPPLQPIEDAGRPDGQ
jgi:hypothetical protein